MPFVLQSLALRTCIFSVLLLLILYSCIFSGFFYLASCTQMERLKQKVCSIYIVSLLSPYPSKNHLEDPFLLYLPRSEPTHRRSGPRALRLLEEILILRVRSAKARAAARPRGRDFEVFESCRVVRFASVRFFRNLRLVRWSASASMKTSLFQPPL